MSCGVLFQGEISPCLAHTENPLCVQIATRELTFCARVERGRYFGYADKAGMGRKDATGYGIEIEDYGRPH